MLLFTNHIPCKRCESAYRVFVPSAAGDRGSMTSPVGAIVCFECGAADGFTTVGAILGEAKLDPLTSLTREVR